MAEFFLILNTNYDVIYEKMFMNPTAEEFCTLILFSHAMIDLLSDIRRINKNYFYCIETQFDWNVSVYLMNSGMVLIYLNKAKRSDLVLKFFNEMKKFFKIYILDPFWDEEKVIDDVWFEEKCIQTYCDNFTKY